MRSMTLYTSISLLLLFSSATATPLEPGIEPTFSGPWERYVQAVDSSKIVRPVSVFKTEGVVTNERGANAVRGSRPFGKGGALILQAGSFLSVAFDQNIAGIVSITISNSSILTTAISPSKHRGPKLHLTHAEGPTFVSRVTDGTGDTISYDLPVSFSLSRAGNHTLPRSRNRGGFKFLSFFLDDETTASDTRVVIEDVWVEYRAMPHWQNPRAYAGYFYSSDNLLNRIWYAGAYTLQLGTIDPKEGSSLVDYNRRNDGNEHEIGYWESSYQISNGTSVTTDGAKRDRMVWPGDMTIAIPGIAVSTYDLISVKNALDTLFAHQYPSGALPYAGPPMGFHGEFSDTYHLHTLLGVSFYVLYTADLVYLAEVWPKFVSALEMTLNKIDDSGLMEVTSGADWLRPGLSGHASEPNAILYHTLDKAIALSELLSSENEPIRTIRWRAAQRVLKEAYEKFWDEPMGLYKDNLENRQSIYPQDGNSWALLAGDLVPADRAARVSKNLKRRWGPFGAPAVEMEQTISPFATGFELKAHVVAGEHGRAVELMRMMWGYMLDGEAFTNSTLVEGYSVNGDVMYPAYMCCPSRNSHAHGWSTGPTHVLSTNILGIELLSLAGKTWSIKPHPVDLEWVEGGYSTTLGNFTAKYDSRPESAYLLEIATPTGTSGHLEFAGWKGKVQGGKHRLVEGRVAGEVALWSFVEAQGWQLQEGPKLVLQPGGGSRFFVDLFR